MTQLLYFLPLLACPLVMGGMMLFMMRGSKQPEEQPSSAAELSALRQEVERLRTGHQAEA